MGGGVREVREEYGGWEKRGRDRGWGEEGW